MVDQRDDSATLPHASGERLPARDAELPVVARIVVEVRSDGSRTIARGAMEDVSTGTRAAIEAAGSTPLELAMALAKSIVSAPGLARRMLRSKVRGLLRGGY